MVRGFSSTLYSNVKSLHVSEDQAAWLGFWMTMAGCAGAVAIGALLDRFAGRLKLVTSSAMALATLCFVVFSATCAGYLPHLGHDGAITLAYVSGILGGTALNVSARPLGMQRSRPTPELRPSYALRAPAPLSVVLGRPHTMER